MAAPPNSNATQPIFVPPTPAEEEERPLKRIIKKFQSYTSLAHTPIVPVLSGTGRPSSVQDAREGFLVELSAFQLLMKKSAMICEAEARQVEEYQREKEHLDNEHETLKAQIEELKVALEQAQMLRKRKIEYDVVAEKVNSLPSRDELESEISALENDISAIRNEHETQDHILIGQKTALDGIIAELSALRFMGKEPGTASVPPSGRGTPAPDAHGTETQISVGEGSHASVAKSEGETESVRPHTETAPSEGLVEDTDIEMGEVEEDPRDKNKKKDREEMEEGEATDASSELSEPPDD
ncbi:hypothetical protein D9619_000515 [Psilocybe cf. subviscida]|uniref:Uncharacterized protein n=1 Tax=Psilocybe cf. subviscida TaxID=2480587 RepID=A0A8H5F252_9AGAR|nr:hypothetical protein D9619_000515 [Psilocybe cf. subviscida]